MWRSCARSWATTWASRRAAACAPRPTPGRWWKPARTGSAPAPAWPSSPARPAAERGEPMGGRFVVVVIDSCGAGEMPDAAAYGDEGAHTLGNCARAVGGLDLPVLGAWGLGNLA